MTTDRDFDSTAYGRGYKDGKREATVEINRLRERLEIDPRHPYDGINCRDETIRGQDAEITRLKAEVERKDAALRDAYEVYAGSDGFIPETAAEGYQQQIIKQMVDCISAALSGDKQ